MATPNALSQDERTARLKELMHLRADADQLAPHEVRERFLPLPAHERALSRDIMIVRGDRGAGKSMLFKMLNAPTSDESSIVQLIPGFAHTNVTWVDGFAETGTSHPSTELIARFVEQAPPEQQRVMWMGHLIGRIRGEVNVPGHALPDSFIAARQNINQIDLWTKVADAELTALTSWLDGADKVLASQGREVVVLYDHLDKIGTTSQRVREQAVASLLALWLSFSNRYRSLRPKVFVREDLFDASLSASADASKLRSRSVALAWDTGSLYRLLIRQMAALSPEMREWIDDTQNRVPLDERAPFGWFPPDPLPETGRPSQAKFVEHLAGAQMGRGVKKGYVYNWIPNRLRDARGAIVPRSLLNLIGYAAEHARHTPKAKYKRLLHPRELQAALEQTSKQRVREIGEEQTVVFRLAALRNVVVPVERAALMRKMSTPSDKEDAFERDGGAVVAELARIGVLRDRGGGRWDVPDIYRYGYGIKRRGGAPSS